MGNKESVSGARIAPRPPSGMPDRSLRAIQLRAELKTKAIACFERYGFVPLETAAMELNEVLSDQYGTEGDKLIFRILNSGDFLDAYRKANPNAKTLPTAKELRTYISKQALRYDLTVPLARYVAAHQHELTFPFRRYQIQPVWRADRPQSGRFREFYQCDVDVVGDESTWVEAEMIALAHEVLHAWGIKEYEVCINHKGLLEAVAENCGIPKKNFQAFCVLLDKWNSTPANKGYVEEISALVEGRYSALKVKYFFSLPERCPKVKAIQAALEGNIQVPPDSYAAMECLEDRCKKLIPNAKIVWDTKLARGLDYYTGFVFEVRPLGETAKRIGGSSLLGGGRYDNLIGRFSNQAYTGVGMSFGLDRVLALLEAKGALAEDKPASKTILVADPVQEVDKHVADALRDLRAAGIPAEAYWADDKLKKVFQYADKKGFAYLVLVDTNEKGEVVGYTLKDLRQRAQHVYKDIETLKGVLEDKGYV